MWNDSNDTTLSIRDEVNASNVMTWEAGGNVGIGIDNPSAELEIASSTATIRLTDSDLTNHYSEIEKAGAYLSFYSRANPANGGLDSLEITGLLIRNLYVSKLTVM